MTSRRQGKTAGGGKRARAAGSDARFVRRDFIGHFAERGDSSGSLSSRTGTAVRAARKSSVARAAAARPPSSGGGGSPRRRLKPGAINADYLALVRRFPLRPIRGAAEYDAAAEVLDGLVTKDENRLTAGERDYVDTLTLLVERYDDEHHRIDPGLNAPLETLKYLMEQSGMGVADLGRVLGSQPAASMVLHGRRELSKNHIRKLADHFRVEAGLFL